MALRTYTGEETSDLIRIDGEETFTPGVRVGNKKWDNWGSKYVPGMVIAVDYEENCQVYPKSVTVLWPIVPVNDFSKFVMPNIRHVHAPQYHLPLNPYIQPMTQPSGLIFYLDYQYNSGSTSGSVK